MHAHAGKLSSSSSEGQRAWANALRKGLQAAPQPADVVAQIAAYVASDMVSNGMPAERARLVAERVVRG